MNLPNSENEVAITRSTAGPEDPKDSRNLWEKFVDGFRQAVGFKPVFLAEKFAAAKVRQENAKALKDEADAYKTMLEARGNYEEKMAKVRLIEQVGHSPGESLAPVVQKQLNASSRPSEEMLEELKEKIREIEVVGGQIEIVEEDED